MARVHNLFEVSPPPSRAAFGKLVPSGRAASGGGAPAAVAEVVGPTSQPLLTDDLAGAWDFTTDASDGTANALNLASAGGVTYDADGAHFDGAHHPALSLDTNVPDQAHSLMIEMVLTIPTRTVPQTFFQYGSNGDNPHFPFVDVEYNDTGNRLQFVYGNDDDAEGPWYASVGMNDSNPHHVMGWYDHTAAKVYIQLDGGSVIEGDTVLGGITPWTDGYIYLPVGGSARAYVIKHCRLWAGTGAVKTDAQRAWLYNSGAGRTYAELAAYTG